MSRFLIPGGFFLLLAVFAVVLSRINTGEYNPRDIPTEFIGRAAPAIDVPDLNDPQTMVRSSDMAGRVWLFNVWGTWCPECWREHKYLLALTQRTGIPIIGLNWRDERPEAQAMLARMGNPFLHIGFDPHSSVAINWGVYGAPETFMINAKGIIVAKHAGAMNPVVWEEKFKPFLQQDQKQP